MADIKTRETVRSIKTPDRSAQLARRMKDAALRTREAASPGEQETPTAYAEEQTTNVGETVLSAGTEAGISGIQYGARKIKERHDAAPASSEHPASRESEANAPGQEQQPPMTGHQSESSTGKPPDPGERGREYAKQQVRHRAEEVRRQQAQETRQAVHTLREAERRNTTAPKTWQVVSRTIKKREAAQARKAAQKSVKTAEHTVKTAEKTSKAAIKTAKQAEQAAQKAAQASAKAARAAAQAAKVAVREAIVIAKAVGKAIVAMVKAIIAALQELVAAIAAGGWVAVLIIVVICLVGLIVGSCFGIFFSGEDTGTGQNMPTAIREINREYEARIEEIKAAHPHDALEMSGSRAVWPEVLSIYAVKTTTDPESAQEVASMDDAKRQLLASVFWAMNEISFRTESHVANEVTETDDGQGHITRVERPVTKTTLFITVAHKTAEEMATSLHFDEDQLRHLHELLSPEHQDLWSAVLTGVWAGNDAIVQVAMSQIGNVGGRPYWSWYGFGSRVEWCCCFVSWCADQCGYLDAGVIPRFSVCDAGSNWFKAHGQWLEGSATPSPGMIIFFDWNYPHAGQDGDPDHVGIVSRVEGGRVYTVEGNSGDACMENSYALGYYEIYGYGVPTY